MVPVMAPTPSLVSKHAGMRLFHILILPSFYLDLLIPTHTWKLE